MQKEKRRNSIPSTPTNILIHFNLSSQLFYSSSVIVSRGHNIVTQLLKIISYIWTIDRMRKLRDIALIWRHNHISILAGKIVKPVFCPTSKAVPQYTNASDDLPVNNTVLRVSKIYRGVTEDSVLLRNDTVLYGVIGYQPLEGTQYLHLQPSVSFHLMNTAHEVHSFKTSWSD